MDGWIKVYRSLASHELWLAEPFTKGQAWTDLLLLANHEKNVIEVRGIRVTIERGQVGWSEERLARRWKWSRCKLRTFFVRLEKEQQIRQQKNNVSSLITIINYDKFQEKDSKIDIQKDSRKTPEKHQKNTNKNEKNKKYILSDGREFTPIEFFELLWKAYPAKDGKKEAFNHFKASVKTSQDADNINIALANYLDNLKVNDWKQPKNGKTWFNNWQDWIMPQ